MAFQQIFLASIISLFVLVFPCSTFAVCDFENTTCVKVEAKATVPFSFSPLFSSNPSFVYAYDSITAEESANQTIYGDSLPGPESKWGFWLDYDPKSANLNRTAHYTTSLGLLFAGRNTTLPDPSGGHNGCDGSLGQECAQGLIDYFKTDMTRNPPGTLFLAWEGHELNPLNASCPPDILDDFFPALSTDAFSFATENGDETEITPPGNSSSLYIQDTEKDTSFDAQGARIAIGMMLRVSDISELADKPDEIQLEIVCMRATPTADDGESGGSASPTATATATGQAAATTGAAIRVASGSGATIVVGGLCICWAIVTSLTSRLSLTVF